MKKFNKSGHLQGNTTLNRHSSPFIRGNIPVNTDGCIQTLVDTAAPWNKEINITTEAGSISIVLRDDTTKLSASSDSGHLQTIVALLNNHSSNNIVTAFVQDGVLLLQSQSSGEGSFIRISGASSYPNSAVDFGLPVHPHSQATVYYEDVLPAAINSLTQKNPPGTAFIAKGEDRSSANYNRALYSVATNTDSNQAMLDKKIARLVSFKLELDSSGSNSRFIVDPTTNTVKAINMSSTVSDSLSSILENRVLVGALTKQSTQRDIRRLFQVTDTEQKELLATTDSLPVRVSGVITGSATGSNPVGPFVLDSAPSSTMADASAVGDNKNVLSIDIPRATGTQSVNITAILDSYTVVCDSAAFVNSLGVNTVFPGDKVVIAGSAVNNGTFTIENVISATTLELKPDSFETLQALDISESTPTGNVSVSTGGMFIKDVTLYLTERIQLPLSTDIRVTMPIETKIGDLEEDALISQNNIEVSHWVQKNIYLEKSLDGVYKGTAAGRKAAGYYINADVRPVQVNVGNYRQNSPGSVIRTISGVSIKHNNLVELDISTQDVFGDDDIGRFIRFNRVVEPTYTITDGVLLNQELAVIVRMLDSKRVFVKKVSRETSDIPAAVPLTSIDIVSETATPFLSGSFSTVHTNTTDVGNFSQIIENVADVSKLEPDAYALNMQLVRLHKLGVNATDPVFSVSTGNDSVTGGFFTTSGVEETYLSLSYPLKNSSTLEYGITLLARIYNGPNAGWYRCKEITTVNNEAKISITSLAESNVTLAATSVIQYGSIYRVSEGSRLPQTSTVAQSYVSATSNTGNDSIGAVVTWKGAGKGVYVYSNRHDNTLSDVTSGFGSLGSNIESYAGPGTQGILTTSFGVQSFTSSQMSADAEITIDTIAGLGGSAMIANSSTYHLDFANNTIGSEFTYRGGSVMAASLTDDPAGVFKRGSSSDTALPTEIVSSASLIAQDTQNNQLLYGANSNALGIYGNIYMPSVDVEFSPVAYTEATLSATKVLSARPGIIDLSTTASTVNNQIGTHAIIGRTSYDDTGSGYYTRLLNPSYSTFNVKHDFIIKLVIASGSSSSNAFGPFFSLKNPKDAVGSFVFFPEETAGDGITAFTAINSVVDNTLHTLPFRNANEVELRGCKLGFKVVACDIVASQTSGTFLFALSSMDTTLTGQVTAGSSSLASLLISTIWYKPRFSANIDIQDYARIGGSSDLEYYRYQDGETTKTAHRTPVLYSREINQDTSYSTISINSSGLQSSTTISKGITRVGLPSANSSLSTVASINDLPSAFLFDKDTDTIHQSPDYSVKVSDAFAPGFAVNNLAKNGQSISFGAHSIILSASDATAIEEDVHVGMAIPSSVNMMGQWYAGGGLKKLIIENKRPYPVSYTLSIKVGTNFNRLANGFKIRILAVNSAPTNNFITATLRREGTGGVNLHSQTLTVVNDQPLHLRRYSEYVLEYNSSVLEGCKDTLDTLNTDASADPGGFYVKISFLVAQDYLQHTTGISGPLLVQLKDGLKSTITSAHGITGDNDYWPDVWFVQNIAVEYDKKQAVLSSGLDVDGVIQPRNIRMLAPVTGYQVVGPSSVDLLQNSEYGNRLGHDRVYSEERIQNNTVHDTYTILGQRAVNLEGRDVGLLPMWYSFYPMANNLNLTHLDPPAYVGSAVNNPYIDYPNYPEQWDEANPYRGHFNTTPQSVDAYRREEPGSQYSVRWSQSIVNGNPSTVTEDEYYIGDVNNGYNSLDSNFFKDSLFPVRANVTFVDSYFMENGIVISDTILTYALPATITKYYRPKFDRSSFFRKGVHSASIHGHHPYFDPLFYWLHCAQAITYSRDSLEHVTNQSSSQYSGVTRGFYDGGSYRLGTGPDYTKLIDSKVNPDAYIPPGKTGFVVPLDPPHGARLTEIDVNLTFRPMATREAEDYNHIGDLHTTYGVWHNIPTHDITEPLSDKDGRYWLGSSGWDEKEGYLVRLWRHSPFEDSTIFGEPISNTARTQSHKATTLDGRATLLHEEIVNIRSSSANGGIGLPSDLINVAGSTVHEIDEGISRLKIKLADDSTFIADRSSYSYFVTIEFYIGVRKKTSFTSADSSTVPSYIVPGLEYTKMDRFGADHAPYMWTAAFPGNRPTSMSTVYGNDPASRWEGYWTPYPSYAALDSKWHKNTVYRRHRLNDRYGDTGFSTTEGTKGYGDNNIAATPNLESITAPAGSHFTTFDVDGTNQPALLNLMTNNRGGLDLMLRRGYIPDHTVWYPVVKFRGIRLSYEMDRPGHGGWGG